MNGVHIHKVTDKPADATDTALSGLDGTLTVNMLAYCMMQHSLKYARAGRAGSHFTGYFNNQ